MDDKDVQAANLWIDALTEKHLTLYHVSDDSQQVRTEILYILLYCVSFLIIAISYKREQKENNIVVVVVERVP